MSGATDNVRVFVGLALILWFKNIITRYPLVAVNAMLFISATSCRLGPIDHDETTTVALKIRLEVFWANVFNDSCYPHVFIRICWSGHYGLEIVLVRPRTICGLKEKDILKAL